MLLNGCGLPCSTRGSPIEGGQQPPPGLMLKHVRRLPVWRRCYNARERELEVTSAPSTSAHESTGRSLAALRGWLLIPGGLNDYLDFQYDFEGF